MSPDELKVRARRLAEELLTQGDLAVADELVATDCRHHGPEPIAPGVDGLKAWVAVLRQAFPDLRAIVEDEIAEGDTVVQRLTLGGTHDGPLFGAAPTGRRAAWPVVEFLRAGPDGRFVERRSSWDRLGLLRQLGLVPGSGERMRIDDSRQRGRHSADHLVRFERDSQSQSGGRAPPGDGGHAQHSSGDGPPLRRKHRADLHAGAIVRN